METDMSHIIAIGYLGIKRCYLDIDEEEAKARYMSEEGEEEWDSLTHVTRVELKDGSFAAYDIWEAN
jgi:hypothetical protein